MERTKENTKARGGATWVGGFKKLLAGICMVELLIFGVMLGFGTSEQASNKELKEIKQSLVREERELNTSIVEERTNIEILEQEIETLSNANIQLEQQVLSLEEDIRSYNEQIKLLGGDAYEY